MDEAVTVVRRRADVIVAKFVGKLALQEIGTRLQMMGMLPGFYDVAVVSPDEYGTVNKAVSLGSIQLVQKPSIEDTPVGDYGHVKRTRVLKAPGDLVVFEGYMPAADVMKTFGDGWLSIFYEDDKGEISKKEKPPAYVEPATEKLVTSVWAKELPKALAVGMAIHDEVEVDVKKAAASLASMLEGYGEPESPTAYPVTWKAKNGSVFLLEEMKDDHLESTIYFLRKRAEQAKEQAVTNHEMMGNHAVANIVESKPTRQWLEENDKHYKHFLKEAARRSIWIDPDKGWLYEPEIKVGSVVSLQGVKGVVTSVGGSLIAQHAGKVFVDFKDASPNDWIPIDKLHPVNTKKAHKWKKEHGVVADAYKKAVAHKSTAHKKPEPEVHEPLNNPSKRKIRL